MSEDFGHAVSERSLARVDTAEGISWHKGVGRRLRAFVVLSVLEANGNVFLTEDWRDKRR